MRIALRTGINETERAVLHTQSGIVEQVRFYKSDLCRRRIAGRLDIGALQNQLDAVHLLVAKWRTCKFRAATRCLRHGSSSGYQTSVANLVNQSAITDL